MKKIIVFMLGLLLVLSGCGASYEKEYSGVITEVSEDAVSVDIGGGKLIHFTVTSKTKIERYLIDVGETVPMTLDEVGVGNEAEVTCESYAGYYPAKEIKIIQKKLR